MPSVALAAGEEQPSLCVAHSGLETGFVEIRKSAELFDCSDTRFSGDSQRYWLRFAMDGFAAADEKLQIEGENVPVGGLQLHVIFKSGEVFSESYDNKDLAEKWRPKNGYAIGIKANITEIETIYVAVDNPSRKVALTQMRVERTEDQRPKHFLVLVMFAVLMGMILVPIIYDLFFFHALKSRFMLWHCVAILSTLTFTYSSSGIMFLVWEGATLETRSLFNYWALAMGVWSGSIFMLYYIEPENLGRKSRIALIATGFFPLIGTVIDLHLGQWIGFRDERLYFYSFIPPLTAFFVVMMVALRRGSRAVKFQLVAWIPIIIFGLDRVARGAGFYIGYEVLDYGLYFALVLETLIIALGVADRVFRMRMNYLESLSEQDELQQLAHTDGLTGLCNRRSFEANYAKGQKDSRFTHLAILDIDFFKQINDVHGHEVGDDVLRAVGKVLQDTEHFTARIGGEEFALLIETDRKIAGTTAAVTEIARICEMLIIGINKTVLEIEKPVTFSVGIAKIPVRASLRSVMAVADRRLYDAKNNGRNQIVSFDITRAQKSGPEDLKIA